MESSLRLRQIDGHARHAQPLGVGFWRRDAERFVRGLGGDGIGAADSRQRAAVDDQRGRLRLVVRPGAHPVQRGDGCEDVVKTEALQIWMSCVADAEDRNGHSKGRQHDEKPRREWIDRILQREARCVMNEKHPPRHCTGTERRRGREAGNRGCERGATERNPANQFAPPAQQQRGDHDCGADDDDGADAQRRVDHRSSFVTRISSGPADMQRM